jgi:peptidoglycan hydrolase-like protein with peptidoglycan-binding domain
LVVDGIFGHKTDEAVKEFQRDNDLTVDGIVGIKTRTKLKEKLA